MQVVEDNRNKFSVPTKVGAIKKSRETGNKNLMDCQLLQTLIAVIKFYSIMLKFLLVTLIIGWRVTFDTLIFLGAPYLITHLKFSN